MRVFKVIRNNVHIKESSQRNVCELYVQSVDIILYNFVCQPFRLTMNSHQGNVQLVNNGFAIALVIALQLLEIF